MNILYYTFALILINSEYLIHGLWPTNTDELSCCNVERYLPYSPPSDTTFIKNYWLDGLTKTKIEGCNITSITLFEHEALKHGSCMDCNSEQYLEIVKKVYTTFKPQLEKLCDSKKDCNLILDTDFSLKKVSLI